MEANEKAAILKKAGEILNDHLKEGRTYYSRQIKTEHGTQSGKIFFIEKGVEYHWPYNKDEALKQEMDDIDDRISDISDLDKFYRELPPFTKYEYIFRKGEPADFKIYSAKDLIEDYKQILRNEVKQKDDDPFKRYEAIVRFEMQADELGMFVDATTTSEHRSISRDFIPEKIVIECLYAALDKKPEALYMKLENNQVVLESKPAFPDLGLEELTHESITLEASYGESKKALLEAQRKRHEIYSSWGKMDERKIYLNVGGFRSHNWPENSTTHISEIMRVIHTEHTTVLISDGLSDIYLDKADLAKYNGIGAEFYLEFAGHVPFETVKDHFCLALLNSVTQIAIEHGDFKAFMEKHSTATIEFREENVELWCVQGNNSNKEIKTFFRDEQYEDDNFGTFLGMPSKAIPLSMKLNKEDVLLVSVKPFGCEWLAKDKLRSEDNDTKAKIRLQMMEHFNSMEEGNTIPVTYNEGGSSQHPEKSGIVETPLIPTKNLR